jgi:hypothetical protein
MTISTAEISIVSSEELQSELYAVFVSRGPGGTTFFEERVLRFVTYEKRKVIVHEGETYRTKRQTLQSTTTVAGQTPSEERAGFLGHRPVIEPREAFAKRAIDGELERKMYTTQVTDDWSIGDPDAGGDDAP